MSTKIYHGYTSSLSEMESCLKQIKEILNREIIKYFARFIEAPNDEECYNACNEFFGFQKTDYYDENFEKHFQTCFSQEDRNFIIFSILCSLDKEKYNRLEFFESSILVFISGNFAYYIVNLPYMASFNEEEVKKKNPTFQEFMYFNNQDRPDTYSEEEWDHRRVIWNHVFKNGVAFLKYLCIPEYDMNNILPHVDDSPKMLLDIIYYGFEKLDKQGSLGLTYLLHDVKLKSK